jgi:hypothetical protein
MAYESRPGDAVAWARREEDNPKGPDFKGSIIVHRDVKAGEKISLALWKKDAGRGVFLSGKVEDFKTRPQATPTIDNPPADDGADIPF